MAVDRPADDDPEEIGDSFRDNQRGPGRLPADSASAEIAEPRTRAEYYQVLQAAADQQARVLDAASASADTSRRDPPGTMQTRSLVRR